MSDSTPVIDIRPDHWEIVQKILQKHVPQYAVWAFGSRAKWTAKAFSDLDLVVITDRPLSLAVGASLSEDFCESDLPYKVDVVDWATTSESFRKIIERDKVVVQEGKSLGGVSEWKEDRFGSLVRFVSDKSQAKEASIDTYISTENMVVDFGGITLASALPISGSVTRFKKGDTLFSNIRTYFKKVWQAKFDGYSSNDVLVFRPANVETLLADYLHQICRWEKFTELSIRTSKGAKMPRGDKDALADFKFKIPPLSEQRVIAHILGTLDDKIELNRKQNETLEAMARGLFKAWFVDFEPVRAKLQGRWQRSQSLPGLPAHLYDIFPDRLVESELGEIPEGWEVASVDVEFDVTMGQSPPGNTYNETGEGIPFYQGRSDFEFRFPKRRVYCTAPTRLAKNGDTLVSVRAPVGDINMASEDCAIGRGVGAVRHKTGCRSYTYQLMSSISDVFARFDAEGTVFGSIGKKDFHSITHVKPPRALVLAYEKLAAQPDDQIERNERESRSLAQLRDTLLPKLISGELRVPDAAAFLKERGL